MYSLKDSLYLPYKNIIEKFARVLKPQNNIALFLIWAVDRE